MCQQQEEVGLKPPAMPNAFGALSRSSGKGGRSFLLHWKMLLSTTSQAAAGAAHLDGQGGRESCAVEERGCSTPPCSSQNTEGITGTGDIPPTSVPAPDPKLTNTFHATEAGICPLGSPRVPPERLSVTGEAGAVTEQTFLPASRPDLYTFPPPSFQEERSQSSVYSQKTGEKNERKEVNSLSPTLSPPVRVLHL